MRISLVFLLILAACNDPLADDQRQFDMAQNSGDTASMCRISEKARDDALAAKKDDEYTKWMYSARAWCKSAL